MLLGLVISSSVHAAYVSNDKAKTIITKGKIISWFNHENELSTSVTYEIIYKGNLYRCRTELREEDRIYRGLGDDGTPKYETVYTFPYVESVCYNGVIKPLDDG